MDYSSNPPVTKLLTATNSEIVNYDSIVLLSAPSQKLPEFVAPVVNEAKKYDQAFESEVSVVPLLKSSQRLIYYPIGSFDPDYDDVRKFKEGSAKAIKRALKAGSRKPLLLLNDHPRFEKAALVTLLGVLEALYTPIQVREHDASKANKVDHLGIWSETSDSNILANLATIIESGRRVACDIGDADPERMSPPRIEEYIRKIFANSSIKLSTVSDLKEFSKDYPLFEAVNRAAHQNERHRGRIVYLEYNPPETPRETIFLVGKGVTYDTGGANVKVGGGMLGMSRDKCGAAAAVGFMRVVDLLRPKHLKVVVGVGLVRNSIGSNSYVPDEVITARSGARVRVINTDAEGRMIMADILCKFKEQALEEINPHLYTIATLTGHAWLTVGDGYSIVIDNGPAYKTGHCFSLQKAGDIIGDPFEISTLRREDISSHKGKMEGDDVVQGGDKPSAQTPRGHQNPAAFLLLASGLDKYGSDSQKPLKYSHLDIAASAGSFPDPATGSPVLALVQKYLL
ncbi:putative aminopeptidase W07G4.4 [Cylas formicarius]|uniref:putative aminopeptidase W07G4.4 n=1 Tax=Cylas formicarius TaxID=197179 RepID=UPI0029585791|nr:putative aminopeptidase W07G4.4 [Cylas formicarius]